MARKKPIKKENNIKQEENLALQKESIFSKIKPAWIFLGLILLVTLFIRLKFLEIPFERDEGTYTYFGQLLLDGQTPYIDFYEMKYPGIYYSYAVLIAIFGATVSGIHFAFILLNLATIYFLFRTVQKLFGDVAGVVSGASYAVLSLAPHVSGFTVQSEHLVTFYSVVGLWFLVEALEKEKIFHFVLSGIFIGMSFMVKQNGVFFILFGGIIIVLNYVLKRPIDFKSLFKNASIYSLGVFIPFIMFCLLILSMGAFKEFWYFTYEFPQTYVEEFDPEQGKKLFYMVLERITQKNLYMWYLAAFSLVGIWFSKAKLSKKIFMVLFVLFSFVSITPGLRFYGHYWLMFMPGVAVAVGAAVYSIKDILENFRISQKITTALPITIFVIVLLNNWSQEKNYYLKPNHTNILREVCGTNPFPESKVIGDFIKRRTTEGDEIVVLGSEPQIYYYADRRCPSKHSYTTWLVNAGGLPIAAEFQKEFIQDVEKAMPKMMVFFNHPISWLMHPNADRTIFTWFNEFSQKNYKLVGVADMVGPNQTNYMWDNQVLNYKPQGQYYMWIFERKPDVK